jgi:hypothetical protein
MYLMPVDKNIFYLRPGDDMEMRLTNLKSSESAFRNAAGFDQEEYRTFKVGRFGGFIDALI